MIKQEPANWYAVQTRARNEKVIAERLQEQGLTTFLPLVTEVRRWSDRKKKVELPLFSCYVFVKLVASNNDERMRVYRTNGYFASSAFTEKRFRFLRNRLTLCGRWSRNKCLGRSIRS